MQRKAVKAVLFDMDGVLVDSSKAWFQVMNDTLQHYGYNKISLRYFKKAFGSPIEEDAKTLFHGMKVNEIADFYDKQFKVRINEARLFKDAISTLKKLKNLRIKLALLTNSTRYITNLILKNFKIMKYFDAVVTMEDVRHSKPEPDMVLEACRRLKIKPEHALVVGDTKYDMIAGKKAGVVTVGYKIKGDYRIKSLKEIEKFIYV